MVNFSDREMDAYETDGMLWRWAHRAGWRVHIKGNKKEYNYTSPPDEHGACHRFTNARHLKKRYNHAPGYALLPPEWL